MYNNFAATVEFEKERYKVLLPWKELHDPLPDNYLPSVNQLKSLLHHLRQDSAILNEYNDIFQDQLTRGIIEAVSPSAPPAAQAVHYLTYYPVIRHDKSTSKVCSIHCISLAHYDPLLQKIRGRADGRVPIERERV